MRNALKILPLLPSDMPDVLNIKPADWYSVVTAFQFYFQSAACTPLKVTINQKMVGTGTLILHKNVAWLAHIMVGTEFRNMGIATHLTQQLVQMALKKVSSVLLLATPLGKPVYTKLGFKAVSEYLFFNPEKLDEPISPHIQTYTPRDKMLLEQLDQQITGEIRPKLLKRLIPGTFVYKDQGVLQGCLYAGMGEGLILADNFKAGTSLLAFHLLEPKPLAIPAQNIQLQHFLFDHGFSLDTHRQVCRMIYGNPVDWKPEKIFGRIGGNLG